MLNATVIDQQVRSLAERQLARFEAEFKARDPERRRAVAFVALVVKVFLNLSEDEAIDRLTEGGNDFGIDAFDCTCVSDGEFTVTLFQGKYRTKLTGDAKFPRTAVEKMILAVQSIFDPDKPLTLNPRLRVRVEEARSLVREGAIPQVRVVLCSNGDKWDHEAEQTIGNAKLGGQVTWSHVNHDSLIEVLKAPQPIDATLTLSGRALVESLEFQRVLVGRVAVIEIARLFEAHGDRLLERNIRRYLGLSGNEVNKAIEHTLRTPAEQPNFYFYNNGITITCDKFSHNELQGGNWPVRLSNLQVINGGQTCKTIEHVLRSPDLDATRASVLVRIYELPDKSLPLVQNITYATNSQSPVDLRDLKSNDEIQRKLGLSIQELGYAYRRQRSEESAGPTDITSATAAEAILAVWREQPQQAKYRTTEHFGRLYSAIFTPELNGAQAIVAVLLFRIAENHRKRLSDDPAETFLHYASCFVAMEMGKQVLARLGALSVRELDHTNFAATKSLIEREGEAFYTCAVNRIDEALNNLYGETRKGILLQRLAATFRRGDLMEELKKMPPVLLAAKEPDRPARPKRAASPTNVRAKQTKAQASPKKVRAKQTKAQASPKKVRASRPKPARPGR